jgi:hypothetical protein
MRDDIGASGYAPPMADTNDPRGRKRRLIDASLPKVREVAADQSSAFGILRRPQVDSDRIPQERWDEYANGMTGRLGLNPEAADGTMRASRYEARRSASSTPSTSQGVVRL